jgi:hypothetical protein
MKFAWNKIPRIRRLRSIPVILPRIFLFIPGAIGVCAGEESSREDVRAAVGRPREYVRAGEEPPREDVCASEGPAREGVRAEGPAREDVCAEGPSREDDDCWRSRRPGESDRS